MAKQIKAALAETISQAEEAQVEGSAGETTSDQPLPDTAESKVYLVASPLKHNGKSYTIGGRVMMKEAEAETLVAIGVLAEPGE